MMADKLRKFGADADLSLLGGGEAPDVYSVIKQDMEGWREVLIPIASVLRWDKPYYPAIVVGLTSFIFGLIWLCDLSTLTTISLFALALGILDFGVPYFGAKITGYVTWTVREENQFMQICESIVNFRNELFHTFYGFVVMREDNSKTFFILIMGILSFTAWIGNLVNNLLLVYLAVTVFLCIPGLQRNTVTSVYLRRGASILTKLKAILIRPKVQ